MTARITFDSDRAMSVLGVAGRLTHRTVKPGAKPGIWTAQKWVSETRPVDAKQWGARAVMHVDMRFDDMCNNGNNSFAITADIYVPGRRDVEACGCLHDEIKTYFPELAPLIQWHGNGTDSPMHYVANAVYFASDRDHNGKRAGEVTRAERRVRFAGSAVSVKWPSSDFREWALAAVEFNKTTPASNPARPSFDVVAVPHERNSEPSAYQFGDKYTFAGFPVDKWHKAPFDCRADAEDWARALAGQFELVSIPLEYSKGKARELDKARAVANWPDATDEELSVEPDELKAALLARLPALKTAFREAMEGAGFYWSPEDFPAAE